MMLDLAMYWPKDRYSRNATSRTSSPRLPGQAAQDDANFVYLVTPPIPSSQHQHTEGIDPARVQMVRQAVIKNWGGDPNLQGTWRDATLIQAFLIILSGPYLCEQTVVHIPSGQTPASIEFQTCVPVNL
jgi:hypothetical protein